MPEAKIFPLPPLSHNSWSTVNELRKKSSPIPPINHPDSVYTSSHKKSEVLNSSLYLVSTHAYGINFFSFKS